MSDCGVAVASTNTIALEDSSVALSLVTADQALKAARQCAGAISEGALWCDMNSVAPHTKQAAAEVITKAGGRYVDVAIMAPVRPAGLAVPLLVSGPDADEALVVLSQLGFSNVSVAGPQVGQAAAVKMLRSVMVKGIEALSDEMALAAHAAGVADQVLASLDASEIEQSWAERVAYNQERMATHGLRRAAEMEEAAKTLRALGVEAHMTDGTVKRQREAALSSSQEKDAA